VFAVLGTWVACGSRTALLDPAPHDASPSSPDGARPVVEAGRPTLDTGLPPFDTGPPPVFNGCTDGTREGLVDEKLFPSGQTDRRIAG